MSDKPIRAAGYCRTSSEGQRDNTSIPTQREGIEAYCTQQGWQLVQFYVDEAKTGSTTTGRHQYEQLMRAAGRGEFDVVVVYAITRFGRDGADIIADARSLKRNFGINLVDTKGHFDTRQHTNTLLNFVHAGASEHERLTILERTATARIKRAKEGLLWSGERPMGRSYTKTGQNSGEWGINDTGRKLKALLQRYADGEPLGRLVKEFGFSGKFYIYNAVHRGRLSGVYAVTFHNPEIGIENLRVEVPAVPEVISPELERRVRERMKHNRVVNKEDCAKYRLSGYIRCAMCGHCCTGQLNYGVGYYRHPGPNKYAKGWKQCG
jgi:DNA invertase Pin-like site-specific DNA recombinase